MYSQRTNYSFQVPAPDSKNCLSPSKPSYSEHCCLGGADVTVPKTCRSAINNHGYLWGSLRPVRITVLPGCSPGSWEAESCQSRRYLSLARACLAAASGTLLDRPPGDCKASGSFQRDTLLSHVSPFLTLCQCLALSPFSSPSASCAVESKDPNSSIYVYQNRFMNNNF